MLFGLFWDHNRSCQQDGAVAAEQTWSKPAWYGSVSQHTAMGRTHLLRRARRFAVTAIATRASSTSSFSSFASANICRGGQQTHHCFSQLERVSNDVVPHERNRA